MSVPISILDQMFAKEGSLDPDLIGIHQARAADIEWDRARGESEHQFLVRVTREAAAAHHRIVRIAGVLQVSNIIQLRRPPPYSDAKED